MNKTSMLATLAAAAAVTLGGVALAQSPGTASSTGEVAPKSSTPGAGCTATGNAMSAGNLGGNPTNKNCLPGQQATAAVPATPAAPAAPAAAATTGTTTTSPPAAASTPASSDTSSMASTAPVAAEPSKPSARVARADRN